jgi:hypothetical protein
MLGNLPVIIILNTEVGKDLKKVGQTDQLSVKPVFSLRQNVLHIPVYSEKVKWLHQQVYPQQKENVAQKFTFHRANISCPAGKSSFPI